MKHIRTNRRHGFRMLHNTRSAGAAMMTLNPGESSSDQVENEHPWAEQWVYVVSGKGASVVGKSRTRLDEGSLLLIEKREPHRITNTGRKPLVTLNFYAPPAYGMDGELIRD
jgi:mannose-6-phosphate isomerase-like protein (cupin superfamily)